MRQDWKVPSVSASFVVFIHSPVYDFMVAISKTTHLYVTESINVGKSCNICLSSTWILAFISLNPELQTFPAVLSLCYVPYVLVQNSSVCRVALADTNVICCFTERTPTPEVKKAATLPTASQKPPPVDQRPVTLQGSQRPLPPTPEDKLPEKPGSEYQLCSLTETCEVWIGFWLLNVKVNTSCVAYCTEVCEL
jgi:hypothetical protein